MQSLQLQICENRVGSWRPPPTFGRANTNIIILQAARPYSRQRICRVQHVQWRGNGARGRLVDMHVRACTAVRRYTVTTKEAESKQLASAKALHAQNSLPRYSVSRSKPKSRVAAAQSSGWSRCVIGQDRLLFGRADLIEDQVNSLSLEILQPALLSVVGSAAFFLYVRDFRHADRRAAV